MARSLDEYAVAIRMLREEVSALAADRVAFAYRGRALARVARVVSAVSPSV